MIKSFKHRGLKRFYKDADARLLNPHHVPRIKRLLLALDEAHTVDELGYVGTSLHELKGNRKGTWSLRVTGNWRITFEFEDADAHNVDLEDYH